MLFNVLKQSYKGYKEPLIDSLDVPASHGGLTKMVAFGIIFYGKEGSRAMVSWVLKIIIISVLADVF